MAGLITLSDIESASNTDILQGTRLQTVPAGGFLTFELQSSANDATNSFTCSIQLPNGDTPLNTVRIPAGDATGEIDSRKKLMVTLQWPRVGTRSSLPPKLAQLFSPGV